MPYIERAHYSQLIELLRPLLIMLMCWAHIPFIYGYGSASLSEPQTLLGPFFRDVISRGAVPVLTVISGYLAYYSFNRKSYLRFVGDKTKRVFLPFVLWNLILLGLLWALFRYGGYVLNEEVVAIENCNDVLRAVLGINRLPINQPLYFLRDLFLISLFCPLFQLLARHYISALLFAMLCTGYALTTLTPHLFTYGVMYRSDMVLFFFIGFLFARSGFSLPQATPREVAAGLALLAVFCAATTLYLGATNPDIDLYLKGRTLFALGFLVLLPCFMSGLLAVRDSRCGRFLRAISPYSFIVFLSHFILIYGFFELQKRTGFSLDNRSPLLKQAIFVATYSAACLCFGVLLKKTYLQLGSFSSLAWQAWRHGRQPG